MNKSSRRRFIMGSLMASAAYATPAKAAPVKKEKKSIVHHVFFWLKNPGSATDRDKLIEGLLTLKSIKKVQKLHVGAPASTEKRPVVDSSYDVSELMFFDNLADQASYQTDPIHLKFVETYSHLWDKVIVYDMSEV